MAALAVAATLFSAMAEPTVEAERAPISMTGWLQHLESGSRVPVYVGTYVASTGDGDLYSARLWHLSDGPSQFERVDILTGPSRTIYRHGDEVTIVLPKSRILRTQRAARSRSFPSLFDMGHPGINTEYYTLEKLGQSRIAGRTADEVSFKPVDQLRFGYRIWSDAETGLVLKSQVLDEQQGRVLEQAVFSDINFDPPVDQVREAVVLPSEEGKEVRQVRRQTVDVDALDEGWKLPSSVDGFARRSCYLRQRGGAMDGLTHCVYSDGFAGISLFLGKRDDASGPHGKGRSQEGATRAVAQPWPDADGPWWVSAVGEVPDSMLRALIGRLARSD